MQPANRGRWGLWLLLAAAQAGAHGGGLNAEGCHHDRKRGGYHCHRGGAAVGRSAAGAYASGLDAPRTQRPSASGLRVPADAGSGFGAVYYPNCAAARAAGAAPVRRGEPGYGPHLDRDHDGKGCE